MLWKLLLVRFVHNFLLEDRYAGLPGLDVADGDGFDRPALVVRFDHQSPVCRKLFHGCLAGAGPTEQITLLAIVILVAPLFAQIQERVDVLGAHIDVDVIDDADPLLIVVRPSGETSCKVAALAGDRLMKTISLWLTARHQLKTLYLDAVELEVGRHVGDSRGLPAEDVASSIRDLLTVSHAELLETVASVTEDDEGFNKFAPCVPPQLRKLHLASAVADLETVQLFELKDQDPTPRKV